MIVVVVVVVGGGGVGIIIIKNIMTAMLSKHAESYERDEWKTNLRHDVHQWRENTKHWRLNDRRQIITAFPSASQFNHRLQYTRRHTQTYETRKHMMQFIHHTPMMPWVYCVHTYIASITHTKWFSLNLASLLLTVPKDYRHLKLADSWYESQRLPSSHNKLRPKKSQHVRMTKQLVKQLSQHKTTSPSTLKYISMLKGGKVTSKDNWQELVLT